MSICSKFVVTEITHIFQLQIPLDLQAIEARGIQIITLINETISLFLGNMRLLNAVPVDSKLVSPIR